MERARLLNGLMQRTETHQVPKVKRGHAAVVLVH